MRAFRARYLASEPAFATLHLIDTQIAVGLEFQLTLDRKATRVKVSMALLATAAFLVALGVLVD